MQASNAVLFHYISTPQAFQIVTRIPSVLIKSASKHVELAGKQFARLTRRHSSNSFSDQSPVSSRPVISNRDLRANSSTMTDTSETTSSSRAPLHQASLPNINSESFECINGKDCSQEWALHESLHTSKEGHHQHRQHHRKKMFPNIFRRAGKSAGSASSQDIQSQNTC